MSGGIHPNVLMQEELSWREIDALDRDETFFFVVIGPLEAHGPHLPTGVDYFNAQAFALAAARALCKRRPKARVVISPTLPVGSYTCDFPGSIHLRQRVLRDLVTDWGSSLASRGFKNVVVVSCHHGPRHVVALEEACDAVNHRFGANMIAPLGPIVYRLQSGAYEEKLARALGTNKDISLADDVHGGNWETSLMLLLRPELVDGSYRKLKPILTEEDGTPPFLTRDEGGTDYIGSPALASEDLGKAALNLVARELEATVLRAAEGKLCDEDRHSPYHGHLFFRTNTVAYMATATLALIVIGFWALLALT